jgi:hypothetical protein
LQSVDRIGDVWMGREYLWNEWEKTKDGIKEKPVTVPCFQSQIPHGHLGPKRCLHDKKPTTGLWSVICILCTGCVQMCTVLLPPGVNPITVIYIYLFILYLVCMYICVYIHTYTLNIKGRKCHSITYIYIYNDQFHEATYFDSLWVIFRPLNLLIRTNSYVKLNVSSPRDPIRLYNGDTDKTYFKKQSHMIKFSNIYIYTYHKGIKLESALT